MPTIFDSTPHWRGTLASKTQGLRAKPVSTLIADETILNKLLLDTLEGVGPVVNGQLYCLGNLGDVWLQDPVKLLKKYDLKSIDAQGWSHFMPKPENEVEFFEVTAEMLAEFKEPVYLIGTWGNEIDGVKNCQAMTVGDFIARQTYDHNDQWVVRRKIWLNSYEAKA